MGYPMSAIVGQEEARLALCLLAVNPAVGGVLLIGGRGVGKSVLARGLKRFCTELWMQAGWTEVPVYINQEQLAGKNGILERAKSSWLYMDEINLLADQAGRTLAVEADCPRYDWHDGSGGGKSVRIFKGALWTHGFS